MRCTWVIGHLPSGMQKNMSTWPLPQHCWPCWHVAPRSCNIVYVNQQVDMSINICSQAKKDHFSTYHLLKNTDLKLYNIWEYGVNVALYHNFLCFLFGFSSIFASRLASSSTKWMECVGIRRTSFCTSTWWFFDFLFHEWVPVFFSLSMLQMIWSGLGTMDHAQQETCKTESWQYDRKRLNPRVHGHILSRWQLCTLCPPNSYIHMKLQNQTILIWTVHTPSWDKRGGKGLLGS